MAPRFDKSRNAMIFRRVETGSIVCGASGIGQHPGRGRLGKGRLPDAPGTGKEPGMMHRAFLPRMGELLDGAIMADDHGSRSAIASSNRCVTSSGSPEASMIRTLSGSSAAIRRNARSTFW